MREAKEGYKITELGEIPNEWKIAKIEDLIIMLKSGLSRNLKEQDVGIPCIRSNNIVHGKISEDDLKYWFLEDDKGADIRDYLLDDGDILVNFINSIAQIGKACIYKNIGRPAIYTTNIFRLKTDLNRVDNKFFFYITQTDRYNKEILLITKPAVNQASFTSGDFKNIKVILPPLLEQQKIAHILSTVDEQIDYVDRLIEKTKELKKGLMQQLLTKGIGHTEFKETEVGVIPKEWEVVSMKEIIKETELGTSTLASTENKGTIMLKMGNLTVGGFDLSKIERIPVQEEECNEQYILKKGDFLFNTRNTLELVGKCATWDNEVIKAVFNNNIMRIKFTDQVDAFYMGYYFSGFLGWNELKRIATGTTSVAAIYTKDLYRVKVILPSIEEQREIVKLIKGTEQELKVCVAKKEKLQQLKKGLMQQLLTGKIRVKID